MDSTKKWEYSVIHSDLVQAFFNQPMLYLGKNVGLALRAKIIRDVVGNIENINILDLGCGDGTLSLQFLSDTNHITLLDLAENMLELARQKIPSDFTGQVSLINANFMDFVPEKPYDLVICIGVLAHVQSLDSTIRTISTLLKPGGRILLQFSDQEQLITRVTYLYYKSRNLLKDTYHYPVNKITASKLLAVTQSNRLTVVNQISYWTMPPGFGKLPSKNALKFLDFLYKNNILSTLGGEKIWVLQNDG